MCLVLKKQNKTKQNKNRKTVQVDYFSVNTCRGKGWGERLLKRNLESTTSLLENRMKLMVALNSWIPEVTIYPWVLRLKTFLPPVPKLK